jgi:hypothetical protein
VSRSLAPLRGRRAAFLHRPIAARIRVSLRCSREHHLRRPVPSYRLSTEAGPAPHQRVPRLDAVLAGPRVTGRDALPARLTCAERVSAVWRASVSSAASAGWRGSRPVSWARRRRWLRTVLRRQNSVAAMAGTESAPSRHTGDRSTGSGRARWARAVRRARGDRPGRRRVELESTNATDSLIHVSSLLPIAHAKRDCAWIGRPLRGCGSTFPPELPSPGRRARPVGLPGTAGGRRSRLTIPPHRPDRRWSLPRPPSTAASVRRCTGRAPAIGYAWATLT